MTRQEFIDDVTTASEVFEFCYDEDLDYCSSWVTNDDLDGYLCETIRDMTHNETWDRIRDFLDGIDGGYDFYDSDNDYCGIGDDDVNSVREQILYDFEFDGEEDEDAEFEEDETDYANYAAVPPAAPEVQQLDSGGMNVQDLLSALS